MHLHLHVIVLTYNTPEFCSEYKESYSISDTMYSVEPDSSPDSQVPRSARPHPGLARLARASRGSEPGTKAR
jgi:hypothetical protein